LRDANARRPLPKGLFQPRLKLKDCRGLEHISDAQEGLFSFRDIKLSQVDPKYAALLFYTLFSFSPL